MPNNEDNPLFPLKQSREPASTGKESEASDSSQISHVNNSPAFKSFPFASVPNSRLENAHGMHQSYTQDPRTFNNVPGLMRPGTPQYVHGEPSPIDLRGNLSYQYTRPSGLNHPPSNMNFVPNPSTVPGDYYRNAHVGEGQASDANHSQITGSSLYSGCSQSLTQSTRGTFAAKASASYTGKFDGSFLTLGIGGHNLSGSSSFQSNPAGLPGSMYSSLGAISSHAIQSSHLPEACKQYDSFESSGRNLGITSKPHGTYQGTDPYNHYEGDPASAFLSFSNANSSNIFPGFGRASNLTSESANLMGTTFQTTQGQPPNYHVRNVRDATSASGSNSINVTGVPATEDYLGKLIPALQDSMIQAIGGGSSTSAQSIGHLLSATGVSAAKPLRSTTFAGKVLPQTAEAIATMPGTVGSFLRRPGEQPEYGRQSVNRPMDPRMMGAQTRSGVNQSQPFQITKNLHGSAAGTGPESVRAKANQPSKLSNAVAQPSHKREAVDPPPVASWGRRRKLLHASTAAASGGQRLGTATTVLPPVPSETPHIRRQGSERHLQPLGHKCLICNRDLSFTPEGPVSQPSMPPTVAVLPCGHTFHDHCLQRITPEDQAKDPPCIPCAIGEEASENQRKENK